MSENKINVLVVDDNSDVRNLISLYLESIDDVCLVGEAKDGFEALNMINEKLPDVVLLDVIMPQIDGLGVLEAVAKEQYYPQPKFIMLSSLGQDYVTQKAMSLGASYYLVKPFDMALLVQRIREVSNSSFKNSNDYLIMSETASEPYISIDTIRKTSERTSKHKEIKKEVKKDIHDVECEVTRLMHDIGIPAHIKGYQYVRDAIGLIVDTPEMINGITKQLYPCIAKKYATTPTRVERAVRHAIEVAWGRGQVETFNEIFGYSINSKKGKPTNAEFIAMIGDKIRLSM